MKTIPDEIIEPIILRLACEDTKVTNLLNKVYEDNWFTDSILSKMVKMICNYYTNPKFDNLPNEATMNLLVSKHFKDSVWMTITESFYYRNHYGT